MSCWYYCTYPYTRWNRLRKNKVGFLARRWEGPDSVVINTFRDLILGKLQISPEWKCTESNFPALRKWNLKYICFWYLSFWRSDPKLILKQGESKERKRITFNSLFFMCSQIVFTSSSQSCQWALSTPAGITQLQRSFSSEGGKVCSHCSSGTEI